MLNYPQHYCCDVLHCGLPGVDSPGVEEPDGEVVVLSVHVSGVEDVEWEGGFTIEDSGIAKFYTTFMLFSIIL